MGVDQAALHGATITRGAKGEKRWEVEASAMDPILAVDRALKMDRWLTESIYPGELSLGTVAGLREELAEWLAIMIRETASEDGMDGGWADQAFARWKELTGIEEEDEVLEALGLGNAIEGAKDAGV